MTNKKRPSMLSNFADSQRAKQSSYVADKTSKVDLSDIDPILHLSVSGSSISFQAKHKKDNSIFGKMDFVQKNRNSNIE